MSIQYRFFFSIFHQESIDNTPINETLVLKEDGEKNILTTDSEIKDQESLVVNENMKQEISTVEEEKDSVISHCTNEQKNQEAVKDSNCNDTNTITEIRSIHEDTLKEIKNELDDSSKEHEESGLELSHEIRTSDIELTNTKTNDVLNLTKENNKDLLDSTKNNEDYIIEQLQGNQNDVISKLVENKIINLNISEEIKILDDAAKNSILLDNLSCDKYLQVNGKISPINCNEAITENHIESNVEDVETIATEIQNNLNTSLNEDLEVNILEKEINDKIPLIIDSEYNENIKDRVNKNVANQDSLSNSSDSETIINSESLQHEINDDNVENSEETAVAQPISVITIQTCETVDSDCSEAYLTPNELNDTPKKILEKNTLNVNDHIIIDNDNVVSESNPSIQSNSEIESPSKNNSIEIIEQNTNDENYNKVEQNIDKVDKITENIEENVNKPDENVNITDENVNDNEENVNNIETIKVIETCNETEVESRGDLDIVPSLQEEHNLNNEKGMNSMIYIHKKYVKKIY